MRVIGLVGIGAMLTVMNVLYQALLGDGAYIVAAERSYFQGVALVGVWASERLGRRLPHGDAA